MRDPNRLPAGWLVRVALVAAAAACARQGEPAGRVPARPHYLEAVPLMPASITADTTGTPEAEHRVLTMQAPMDSVADYYRRVLPARGWRLMGGTSDTGQVSMMLQRDSLTLWLVIRKMGPGATQYSLTATARRAPGT